MQPYPGPGGKQVVSIDGGSEPVWSADGRELFHRRGNEMLVVDMELEPNLRPGKPKTLFEGPYRLSPANGPQNFGVSPDGRRFVMVENRGDPDPTELHVVLNWFDEL